MPLGRDPPCPNLKALFGDCYRIGFDPSYDPKGVPRDKLNPWAMTLPCRLGTIYPHGADRLAVEIDYHGSMAKRVAALPGVTLGQGGDNEHTYLFPLTVFASVAAIVKPKRRRRMTPEQKAASMERLAGYRFSRAYRKPSAVEITPPAQS